MFTLKLTNPHSGSYHLDASKTALKENLLPDGTIEWIETGLAIPVSIQRALTAVSENIVRFFHEKNKETLAEYSNSWDPGKDYFDAVKKYCVNFVRTGDNKFSVEAWDSMQIVAGEATYDDGTFTFWYDYAEGSNRNRIQGTLRKAFTD